MCVCVCVAMGQAVCCTLYVEPGCFVRTLNVMLWHAVPCCADHQRGDTQEDDEEQEAAEAVEKGRHDDGRRFLKDSRQASTVCHLEGVWQTVTAYAGIVSTLGVHTQQLVKTYVLRAFQARPPLRVLLLSKKRQVRCFSC